jgi:hypothetical protein
VSAIIVQEPASLIVVEDTAAAVVLRGGPAFRPGYWGAFSSSLAQTAADTTTAYSMTLNSSDANNRGVSVVSNSRVTVEYAGVYNLQFSAQFVNTQSQEHDIDIWLSKNGDNVADSNSRVTVPPRHGGINGHFLAAWNFVLQLSAADYLELFWRTDNVTVSMEALAASSSPTRPAIPSVILTLTEV